MMKRMLSLVLLTSLVAGRLVAGEIADPSRLPPPLAPLPALPADGSGIYRLSLDRALGAAPLILHLEVEQGKATRGVGLVLHNASVYGPIDASKLTYQDNRITGTVKVELMPLYDSAKRGKDAIAYQFKPAVTATFTLDAKCDGATGAGVYSAEWDGKAMPLPHPASQGSKGALSIRRDPVRPLPARFECDMYLYAALGDLLPDPTVWLRLSMHDESATAAVGWVSPKLGGQPVKLAWRETKVTLRDGNLKGRLTATIPGREAESFTLDIDGEAINRQLFGTVTLQHGDKKITTQWVGLVHDARDWRLPLELPSGEWNGGDDTKEEPALVAAAREEALRPVLAGEPGKAGFWTWRDLAKQQPTSVIYPPSFDLEEIPGANRYRYSVRSKSDKVEFTADKPWRPLTPIWKDLPLGTYALTVQGLDAQGKELPAPIRHRILDKVKAQPIFEETKGIAFVKRPSFSGPYASPPKSWTTVSLGAARWYLEMIGHSRARGLVPLSGFYTGGEGGFAWEAAANLWSTLAIRALTTDPAERLLAEDHLHFLAEEFEIHQRSVKTPGVFFAYRGYTPLSHWSAEAVLDAYLQTGDPRWKEMAMRYGEGLVTLQRKTGGFTASGGYPLTGPAGFFARWQAGNDEFGASELLYVLGRIRRDLKTDAFAGAERKAYGWMKDRAVRDRYFPIYVHHSATQGYPVGQHAMSALYFSRYLLECAPPDLRDVKLAEEVARWAEDHDIAWQRESSDAKAGAVMPRVIRRDRINNEPVALNLLAAIVFQELAQETGSKLWAAKGEALAVAVSKAQDPKNGFVTVGLQSKVTEPVDRQFHDDNYAGFSFCRGWAPQLMREYAALQTKEVKK
ncbi:MAG: hypothetical protein WCL32_10495 [Planctomycetota bacterium]